MKYIAIASIVTLSTFILSCNKDSCKTKNIKPATMTYDRPLYKGWPLYVRTESGPNYFYRFQGPKQGEVKMDNNYVYYQQVSTDEDAGLYTVDLLFNGKCIEKQGKVFVTFDTPPAPPCNVPTNTSTTSTIGIGGVSYGYVSEVNGSTYSIKGHGNNQSLVFTFNHDFKVTPGVYKSIIGSTPNHYNEVNVQITGYQYYSMKSGYDVYVNEVNGKLEFSFCNANFTYLSSNPDVIVSAKLKQP